MASSTLARLSIAHIYELDFGGRILRYAFVKILGNALALPAFLPRIAPNSFPIKFCDRKRACFGAGFCAKDEGGLSPGEDDKQHNAENTPLAAGSDMCAMLKLKKR